MSTVHAIVTGHLSADAVTSTNASGTPFASGRLALHKGSSITWVRLVAFGSVAAELGALRKGESFSATGRLKTGAYLDRQGNPATSLELVVYRLLLLAGPQNLSTQIR